MAKITDPSRLLPSTKSTAITKIGKGSFISPIKISKKTTSITKGLISESSDKDTTEVNNNLLNVEKFLKTDLITSKKKAETRRKEKEREDFKKEEEKLEAPKEAKKFNLPGLNVPGMSFLDRIKRFLFFTALGWLFTKFQDQLPKLEGIVKTIGQVYGVAEGIFKSLLNGLVNFIDIGYQTYDGLRKKVEDLGGKDAAKTFDKFSGHLNKLINGAIIAAALIASTDPKITKTPKAPTGGAGYQAGFAAGYAAGIASRGRPGAGFRDPSRYRVPGQARSGGFDLEQTRKAATAARSAAPTGPRGPLDRIGRSLKGAGAQLQTGTLFKRGAGLQKALYNAPGKLKGAIPKGAKFGAGKIPIVGPLITFGIRTLVYGEKPQKAAAAAVGTGVGQAIGTFIGTLGAGALGLGTAGLGAVVAPLIIGAGSVIGGLVGEWIGAKLYDFVAGMGNNKPQLKAAGGSVTRGGRNQGAPKRTIKRSRRRPPRVKPQVSQPGKNVGGKKKIQELYPDPSARVDIEGEQKSPWYDLLPKIPKLKPNATDDEKKDYQKKVDERNAKLKKLPNPYKALTSTAKILKDIPFGIGALMGGAVDIALGQKLPEDAIRGLGNGISYLINSIASRQMSASISNIEKEIVKMQTGGLVPRLRDFTREDSMNTGEGLTKSLNNLIQQKVDQAIKEVQKQMMPGRFSEGGATPRPGTTPPGTTPPSVPPSQGPGGGAGPGPTPTGENGRLSESSLKSVGPGGCRGGCRLWTPAANAYLKMKEAASKEKIYFQLESAYRSYEHQKELYDAYQRGQGNLAAPPGQSDHGLGKAIDLYPAAAQKWVREKGKQYGWYWPPETGEPWHFVYVGGGRLEPPKPQTPPGQQPVSPIFQPPGQTPPAAPGQQPLNPIFQRPGQIPPAAPGQTPPTKKSGQASWYGPDFYGRKTADGTVLERNSLWVAHKTLPLGTKVKFTYNGKTITLPVKDRGPFIPGREWDFTEAAAESIGLKTGPRSGTGTVQYEVIGKKGGGYVTSPNGQRIREFITPGTKDKMPTILDKMPTPMEIRKKNFFEKGSIASYPSYSDGGMMIAIQPIIIEKTVPVPMRSSRGISFPVAGVNNSMGNSSSLNQG